MKVPSLPLKKEEKVRLRKAKVKIADISTLPPENLMDILGVSVNHASKLKGLADFQRVPSIGVKLAEKLVYQLGYFSLEDIKEEDAPKVLDRLEKKLGVWTDPCVEDQIRSVIHFANNPKSDR